MKEDVRIIRHNAPDGTEKVCMLINGKLTADMPAKVATQLGAQLMNMARLIENDSNVNKQIDDNAILMRAGCPTTLTNNPRILKEAYNKAQWDSRLRRNMPNASVESSEIVGTPIIRGSSWAH